MPVVLSMRIQFLHGIPHSRHGFHVIRPMNRASGLLDALAEAHSDPNPARRTQRIAELTRALEAQTPDSREPDREMAAC